MNEKGTVWALLAGLCWLQFPAIVSGVEVHVRLTGSVEFPGMLSLKSEQVQIDRLCFLGEGAKGNLDGEFLKALSQLGIPDGEYSVSGPLPEEKWPEQEFSRNGTLRFRARPETSARHRALSGKFGLAVHGRDFFPLAGRISPNPKMIRFVSGQLFDQLSRTWGTLRISNWDMGRLHDFYSIIPVAAERWQVKVKTADIAEIKKICEPLKVQRKPGEKPE